MPSASLPAVWYSSWVCAITCEVAELADDTLTTYIDVLGVLTTLSCHQVRTDVEAELSRVGASA